jgi:large subunit ribosomal protein L9
MAATVQVVLRDDVEKLGNAGELVRVKPGYARNFLIPRGLAVVASKGNVERLEHERKAAVSRAQKSRETAQELARRIGELTVQVAVPVGEGDRLYGSVTSKDVAEGLRKQGLELDRKKLVLPDSIKQLGEYECSVRLGQEIQAKFKLVVTAK